MTAVVAISNKKCYNSTCMPPLTSCWCLLNCKTLWWPMNCLNVALLKFADNPHQWPCVSMSLSILCQTDYLLFIRQFGKWWRLVVVVVFAHRLCNVHPTRFHYWPITLLGIDLCRLAGRLTHWGRVYIHLFFLFLQELVWLFLLAHEWLNDYLSKENNKSPDTKIFMLEKRCNKSRHNVVSGISFHGVKVKTIILQIAFENAFEMKV